MDRVKKFKKATNAFRVIALFTIIPVFIYNLIFLINASDFSGHTLISTILFWSLAIVEIIIMIVFDVIRYRLLDSVFGKVNENDIIIAKDLLKRIKEIETGKLEFLVEGDTLEIDTSMLKICLKQIIKGHKIHLGLVQVFFDFFNQIEDNIDLFNKNAMTQYKYMLELLPLLERNGQTEI